MRSDETLLENLRVASPCNARWEDMEGDERSRFCRQCTKHVYNFSALTSRELVELIRMREGQLCGRFFKRRDGTVLTADCPAGAERPLHWFKRLISAAAACLCLTGSSAMSGEKQRVPVPSQRALLGEIYVPTAGTNAVSVPTTNKPPFMGRIRINASPEPNKPKNP